MAPARTPRRFRGLETVDILGFEVPVAAGFAARLLGLALLSRGRAGDGLLIQGCRSVHTLGMRFPLDLLFLDAGGAVVAVYREVGPARIVRCGAAGAVLELPSAVCP